MTDLIRVLREAIADKLTIKVSDDRAKVHFGEKSYAYDSDTFYKSQKGKGVFL